jgi:hypothetical protein
VRWCEGEAKFCTTWEALGDSKSSLCGWRFRGKMFVYPFSCHIETRRYEFSPEWRLQDPTTSKSTLGRMLFRGLRLGMGGRLGLRVWVRLECMRVIDFYSCGAMGIGMRRRLTDWTVDEKPTRFRKLASYFTNRQHHPDGSRETLKIRSCKYRNAI